MQNAECKMQNAKCRMQNAKCRMQNWVGCFLATHYTRPIQPKQKTTQQTWVVFSLSGKRGSNPRNCVAFLTFTPPTPERGGKGRLSTPSCLQNKGFAFLLSGKRGSNPRPLAWEANALPTELLPQVARCESVVLRQRAYLSMVIATTLQVTPSSWRCATAYPRWCSSSRYAP